MFLSNLILVALVLACAVTDIVAVAVGKKWNLQRSKERSQAKHLSTAEFKAKKIVEQVHGEADELKAAAERKVRLSQIHADDIVSQAEQVADESKRRGAGISGRRN